jgi:pimeloyl-ACP methyl ester carboxylesterase
MPFVTHQGIRIRYEVEGKAKGPPLVLQHGFSSNLEVWLAAGYAKALRADYQLVLLDARGHGASDKPHDPTAYRLEAFADDVVAVLDALSISKAHYWGYSMGAFIGFEIVRRAPSRFCSLTLGGHTPYGPRTETETHFVELFAENVALALEQGMEAYIGFLEKASGPIPPVARKRLLGNDPQALLAMTKASREWLGIGDILEKINVPCLLYAGEADPLYAGAKEGATHIPTAKFISLPGLDHFGALFASDLVVPHVRQFLDEVGGNGGRNQESGARS